MDGENEVVVKGSKKWSLISIAVTLVNVVALNAIAAYMRPHVLFVDDSRIMLRIARGAGIVSLFALILAIYGAKREWPRPIFALIAFFLCAVNLILFVGA